MHVNNTNLQLNDIPTQLFFLQIVTASNDITKVLDSIKIDGDQCNFKEHI